MPDLGKYAVTVLSSYAVTFALIGVLIGLTIWRGRVVKRQLAQAESRRTQTDRARAED